MHSNEKKKKTKHKRKKYRPKPLKSPITCNYDIIIMAFRRVERPMCRVLNHCRSFCFLSSFLPFFSTEFSLYWHIIIIITFISKNTLTFSSFCLSLLKITDSFFGECCFAALKTNTVCMLVVLESLFFQFSIFIYSLYSMNCMLLESNWRFQSQFRFIQMRCGYKEADACLLLT